MEIVDDGGVEGGEGGGGVRELNDCGLSGNDQPVFRKWR